MKTVWMLVMSLFAIFAVSSRASEFTHIKLDPSFEASLKSGSVPMAMTKDIQVRSAKSLVTSKSAISVPTFNQVMRAKLLGADLSQDKGLSPFQDGEESPLLEEIRAQLELSHQSLGQTQVAQLNGFNQQFNMGTQNFSGFSWQKPFGTVDIHVDRQVIPPALVDQWMVHDTMTITVKATTFLERLKQEGLTQMSDLEIGAFAGISFQRVYTYDHFANSYNEGLTADFYKLFLPFMLFNQKGMALMKPNEVMKRDDLWTLKAGAIVTSPAYYGFSVSGGVLGQADLNQTVAIESSASQSKRFGVAVLSKKAVTAGVTASLQLDFFKLLQLTLLRYDLAYTYASTKEIVLEVSTAQYNRIISSADENAEFKKVMTGWGDVKLLEPYVTQLKDSTTKDLETHGSVLLWGRTTKNGKEVISNIKNGQVTFFHKDYAQNVKYVQDLLSRLFSAFFYKLLKLPVGVQNVAIYSKEVEMEYKIAHPQATDGNVIRLNSSEEFSFNLNQSYEAHGTTKKSEKTYKTDVMWFIDEFTTLPKSLVTAFEKNELVGPVRVESSLKVGKDGFDFFVARPMYALYAQIARVCGSKKAADWASDEKRPAMLKAKQSGAEKCVKDMGLNVEDFLADYKLNYSKPAIAKFSKFLKAFYKVSESYNELMALFGEQNTYFISKIDATSPIGTPFSQTVSHGQFRGLGVIDNFNRAPATVSLDK